jgi:lysophospholipase L1-like esterase
MSPLPSVGATGWGTTLNTYLTERNTPYAGKAAPSHAGTRTRAFDDTTNIYGSETGRAKVRRALGHALGGAKSALVPITLAGDSATSGWKAGTIGTDDYATLLITMLREAGYPVTGGWVYPANGQTPGDSRWTFGGTNSWQGRTNTTNNYVWSAASGNLATFTSTFTGTVAEFAAVTTTAGQSVNYTIDGGASTAYALTANVMNTKTVTGLADTVHTITVNTTGTATVWLCGARVRQTTGLSITNAGIYGSHTDDWLPTLISSSIINPYNLTTGLGGQPKLVILELGGNDALHGVDGTPDYTPATFKANLSTIVNAYQTAGSAVLLRIYPYLTTAAQATLATKQAGGVTWDTFLSNTYDVADTYEVPLIDNSYVLGDPNTLQTAGLLFSDGLHLLSPGQAAIARADFRALQNI